MVVGCSSNLFSTVQVAFAAGSKYFLESLLRLNKLEMKVLALFSLFVAVVTSYPVVKTWTLRELSEAIETSKAEPGMMPYLIEALNQIMLAMFTGQNANLIQAALRSPTGAARWTVEELRNSLADPETKPEYKPFLNQAYQIVKEQNESGNIQNSVEVIIPALDISTWSQTDLTEALKSPSTKPELIPYLEKARKKQLLEIGERVETVSMVTPVGLIPSKTDNRFLSKASNHSIKKTTQGL